VVARVALVGIVRRVRSSVRHVVLEKARPQLLLAQKEPQRLRVREKIVRRVVGIVVHGIVSVAVMASVLRVVAKAVLQESARPVMVAELVARIVVSASRGKIASPRSRCVIPKLARS
jgi:hypothetical protein